MKKKTKPCSCLLCRLARCLSRIAKKCTPTEQAALNLFRGRMESAEMDWEWLNMKARDGEDIELGGRIYKPHGKIKP